MKTDIEAYIEDSSSNVIVKQWEYDFMRLVFNSTNEVESRQHFTFKDK
jgi:hypothetical protein